jgi:ribonuclease Z
VDHLFVEAAFSDRHREVALQKKHLTARQAGELARRCRVSQYSIFHYSPRYSDCPEILEEEAARAFFREGGAFIIRFHPCLEKLCIHMYSICIHQWEEK